MDSFGTLDRRHVGAVSRTESLSAMKRKPPYKHNEVLPHVRAFAFAISSSSTRTPPDLPMHLHIPMPGCKSSSRGFLSHPKISALPYYSLAFLALTILEVLLFHLFVDLHEIVINQEYVQILLFKNLYIFLGASFLENPLDYL